MTDPFLTGAQGLASSLKGAQNIGKDLGKIVENQTSDMEAAVNEQHRKRLQAKAKETALRELAEFKAYEQYEKQKLHERELLQLKNNAIKKYGPKSWNEIEQVKFKIEKERIAEEKLIDNDRRKIQDLFWWCMTASALITYFFRLYK